MLTKLLTSTAISPLHPRMMTDAERRVGRFLRAPDGHDGDGGASGDGGGDAGAGAAGADAGSDGVSDPTVLGGAGDAGADAGAGDAGESGKDGGDGGDAGKNEGAAAGPPEKYELTLPDGFESIDADVLAEATPILKELNLTNEQADKLTPIAAQLVKKTMDRAEAAITNRAVENRKAWNDAFEADPEIGGANKDKTIANAARFFDHYGLKKGEGLRQLLDESGLGNHPDLIRAFARVGADLAEGAIDNGGAASAPKTPEQSLYGSEFQPKG
jgi:hypothetical protein